MSLIQFVKVKEMETTHYKIPRFENGSFWNKSSSALWAKNQPHSTISSQYAMLYTSLLLRLALGGKLALSSLYVLPVAYLWWSLEREAPLPLFSLRSWWQGAHHTLFRKSFNLFTFWAWASLLVALQGESSWGGYGKLTFFRKHWRVSMMKRSR